VELPRLNCQEDAFPPLRLTSSLPLARRVCIEHSFSQAPSLLSTGNANDRGLFLGGTIC